MLIREDVDNYLAEVGEDNGEGPCNKAVEKASERIQWLGPEFTALAEDLDDGSDTKLRLLRLVDGLREVANGLHDTTGKPEEQEPTKSDVNGDDELGWDYNQGRYEWDYNSDGWSRWYYNQNQASHSEQASGGQDRSDFSRALELHATTARLEQLQREGKAEELASALALQEAEAERERQRTAQRDTERTRSCNKEAGDEAKNMDKEL